jgi:hypothetical protein
MTIKNLTRFLMAATLMSTAVVTQAEPVHASHNKETAEAFKHIQTPADSLRRIRGVNLNDEPVRIMSGHLLSDAEKEHFRNLMGENFALSGRYEGENTCMIFIEDRSDEGFMLPQYTGESLYAFIQRDTYMYHLVAHELSHCLQYGNDMPLAEAQQYVSENDLDSKDLSLPALDESVREVHADLTAVLLGASKTGEWSVMMEAVMPLRASYYSPTHTTLNAVSNLINGMDPHVLKGASFDEVVQLSNALFKKRFINDAGQLDLQSEGVHDILREWAVTGMEARAYLEQMDASTYPAGKSLISKINEHQTFAQAIVGDTLWKDAAYISAWRAMNMLEQNQIAERAAPSDDVYRLVHSNQVKISSFPIVVKMAQRLGTVDGDFDQHLSQLKQWQSRFNRDDKNLALKSGLPALLNEAFAAPDAPDYAIKVREAHNKVTALLRDTLNASHLSSDHRVNTLTGLLDNPNTPTLKARTPSVLSKLASLEMP